MCSGWLMYDLAFEPLDCHLAGDYREMLTIHRVLCFNYTPFHPKNAFVRMLQKWQIHLLRNELTMDTDAKHRTTQ